MTLPFSEYFRNSIDEVIDIVVLKKNQFDNKN